MATMEITEARQSVPFSVDETLATDNYPGFGVGMFVWNSPNGGDVPPFWSPSRDVWLRNFLELSDPLKAITNTFINKAVTIPWAIQARDKTIDRYVRKASELEGIFRRHSGSMASSPLKGFKEAFKMFWADYLTQDNGAFMIVLGDGPADGPIMGAPFGLLHLDSALCVRTKNPEFPVKYLNRGRGGDGAWYKIHYTRIIEMSNFPSANTDLNGVGHCAVSCCLAPAQELWDIYRYSQEMFGSRPPRQILYAKKGATVSALEQAIQHWNMKLDNDSRTRFGGTLIAAPGRAGQELELELLNLSQMPEGFDRADTTSINLSMLAAAYGMDLRDIAYTLGAPSRTGDAEVQDRKGRGKGVGEALDTFTERFNEVCVGEQFYIQFDYLDDEQDEQAASIRNTKSEARQRDLMGGLTTIRAERELMWESGEIEQETFDDMELTDGRLPDGLDVLLLFQSQDTDYQEWLDLGVPDPTSITSNDPEKMIALIHKQAILVSEFIHLQTRSDRRRKARQGLAALEKLRLMYEEARDLAIQAEAQAVQLDMQQQALAAGVAAKKAGSGTPTPPAKPGQSPTGKPGQAVTKMPPGANSAASNSNSMRVMKEIHDVLMDGMDFKAISDPADLEPFIEEYERQFRGLVDNALAGNITKERFADLLANTVFATLLALWLQGSHIGEGELTKEEWGVVFDAGEPHFQAIAGITDDIYGGRYAGGNAAAAYTRIAGWLNMAKGFFSLA